MAFCSLSEIIYEPIDDEYGIGKYGNMLSIIIRRRDSYVNITKLCADGGRRFDNWYANQRSKELIAHFERESGMHMLDQVSNVCNELRGTYVHQYLVPAVASWVSGDFAYKAARVLTECMVREYRAFIREKDNLIGAQTDRIDALMKENRYQTQLLEENARKMSLLEDNLIETLKSHRAASERVVPFNRVDAQHQEQMVVLHLGGQNYQCVRGQARYITTQIRRQNARVVLQLDNQPNPVELWLAVKADLDSADFKMNGTYFEMAPEREPWLINLVQTRTQEKFAGVNQMNNQVIASLEWNFDKLMRSKSIVELRDMCKQRNLSGYSRLNKTDLVNFLLNNTQQ